MAEYRAMLDKQEKDRADYYQVRGGSASRCVAGSFSAADSPALQRQPCAADQAKDCSSYYEIVRPTALLFRQLLSEFDRSFKLLNVPGTVSDTLGAHLPQPGHPRLRCHTLNYVKKSHRYATAAHRFGGRRRLSVTHSARFQAMKSKADKNAANYDKLGGNEADIKRKRDEEIAQKSGWRAF